MTLAFLIFAASCAVRPAATQPDAGAGVDGEFWRIPGAPPPWEGLRAGAEDEVPPPWTAPEAVADAFRCWGRTYRFGGAGLVSSIVSGGREFLSKPVAVEVNGRTVQWTVTDVDAHTSFADYKLTGACDDAPISARLRAEFDGFLWFDVTWGGEGAKEVRELKVRFPVRRACVIGCDRCRLTRDDQPLPPGAHGTWRYNPLAEPFFWLGDDAGGVMGGVDSLRGWHLYDKRRGYTLTVDDATAELVMAVVDRPLVASEPRTFGFYVEATPVKPKNLEEAAKPAEALERWCQTDRIFDFKWPGYFKENRLEKFRNLQHAGKTVYYYGSTTAVSPLSPLWEKFGADWTVYASPTSGIVRSRAKTEAGRLAGTWTRGCVNCRSFFEYKLYVAKLFLDNPEYEVENLYYDVAEPVSCGNPRHGCRWKDDFGHVCRDFPMRRAREFHKRLLRLLKRKNPRGILYGHSGPSRTPSDMFFERIVMGENYARAVAKNANYYDVLTPDELRIKYASRSCDTVVDMLPQIVRGLSMHAPDRLKTYDTTAPDSDRAIRHCAAYYKIYDLNIWCNAGGRRDGRQWAVADNAVARLGNDRRYRAYFHSAAPLKAKSGCPRLLWAVYSGRGEGLLIVLNDTDAEVTETFMGDLRPFGVNAVRGADVFGAGEYEFRDGALSVRLPPRESRFIRFEKTATDERRSP